jgi:hypothetical protein
VSAAVGLLVAGSAVALPAFTTGGKGGPSLSSAQAQLKSTAVSTNSTYDRFVVRWSSGNPSYRVRYVTQVTQDGSGNPVTLQGTHFLTVRFSPARAHTAAGGSVGGPKVRTPLFTSLRQMKLAGDFEGVVTYGLGVQGKKPFRVFRLTNPSRLVVDIRH